MTKKGQRVLTRRPRRSRRGQRLRVAAGLAAAAITMAAAASNGGNGQIVTTAGPAGCVVLHVTASTAPRLPIW
jgi:hypothetical protein